MCAHAFGGVLSGACNNYTLEILTKFKRVLQSILEKDRQSGVKEKDFVRDISEDRVLGVLWNIEDDALDFKVALKNKPMTRKGETKNQVVMTNPFILNFLQHFKCSCTYFQAINFSVNPQKSTHLSM